MIDLELIKVRTEAAGPSPWEVNGSPHDRHMATIGRHYITTPDRQTRSPQNKDVAEFIAHARTDVPALVAEVELLRQVARELADALADNGHDFGDDEGCLSCAALNTYGDVFGVRTAGEVDG